MDLRACDGVRGTKKGLERYVRFCNQRRPHSTLDGKTPDKFYVENVPALPRQRGHSQLDYTYAERTSVQTTGATSASRRLLCDSLSHELASKYLSAIFLNQDAPFDMTYAKPNVTANAIMTWPYSGVDAGKKSSNPSFMK